MGLWGILGLSLGMLLLAACGDPQGGAFLDHEEALDFVPVDLDEFKADGVASTFEPSFLLEDSLYKDTLAIRVREDSTYKDELPDLNDTLGVAGAIQLFFQNPPYTEEPCFLATAQVQVCGEFDPGNECDGDGDFKLVSEVIADLSEKYQINPLLLVVRLQVEKSLLSRTEPYPYLNTAMGCGRREDGTWMPWFQGFPMQLECAARTFANRFADSVDGTGYWRAGRSRETDDGVWVKPQNHATAALYAYTPEVLWGRGGNWLVWNVTRRHMRHLQLLGVWNYDDPGFVGSPCRVDPQRGFAQVCQFTDGDQTGSCYEFSSLVVHDEDEGEVSELFGFCTLECEGFCPDRDGVTTFCVEVIEGQGGRCLAKATRKNDHCRDIPGTEAKPKPRYVGDTGIKVIEEIVCAPR